MFSYKHPPVWVQLQIQDISQRKIIKKKTVHMKENNNEALLEFLDKRIK